MKIWTFNLLIALFLQQASALAESFPVGVILPLSGPAAVYGKSAELGLRACNKSVLKLFVEDDSCDAGKSVSSFRKIEQANHASFFIGPLCGAGQQAVAPLIRESKLLAVVSTTLSGDTHLSAGKRMFSTAASAEQESRYNANKIWQRNNRKVALVYTQNNNSQFHVNAFRAAFPGRIAGDFGIPAADPSQMSSLLVRIKASGADAIYVPDAALFFSGFMRKRAQAGLEKIPVYSIYAVQNQDILNAEGDAAEGLIYSYPANAGLDAITTATAEACEVLSQVVEQCKGDAACAAREIGKLRAFDEGGSKVENFSLRHIRNGSFQVLE